MTTERVKREVSPDQTEVQHPRLWRPGPGEILSMSDSALTVRMNTRLETGRTYTFKARLGSRVFVFTGSVQWSRLEGLPVHSGHVDPQFRMGVRVVEGLSGEETESEYGQGPRPGPGPRGRARLARPA